MKTPGITFVLPFSFLLLLSAPAWSDTPAHEGSADTSTVFASVGLGYYDYSLNTSNTVVLTPGMLPGDKVNSRTSGFNVSGGWLYPNNLGLQFDLATSGAVTYTDSSGTTQKAFVPTFMSVSVLFWKDIARNTDIYAKLGGTFWSFQSSSNQTIGNSDSFGPNVGVGADYHISGTHKNGMAVRLEWNYIRGQNILVNHATSLSANLLFTFS